MTAHEPNRRLWALEVIADKPGVTVRGLMTMIGLASPSAVLHVIRGLEADGLIQRACCVSCDRPVLSMTREGYELIADRQRTLRKVS